MRGIRSSVAIAVIASATVVAGEGLPQEVSDRIASAVSFDETDGFVGSYRITISSVVQKPNGKSREESVIEANVVNLADGTSKRQLLNYIKDGSDVTEKKRSEFESEDGGRRNKKDNRDMNLADPFGETADRYRFGPPETRGPTVIVTFEPAAGYEDDESLARGTIAWDKDSREPLWLEMTAVHPPKPLQELQLRTEFEEIDGDLFMTRLKTDGRAKVLLLKREFHLRIRFEDIRPIGKGTGASGE